MGTEVLTQDEIDQLLTAINAGDDGCEQEEFRPSKNNRKIKIYDFKRPDKFTKNQIRTMSNIHEGFARNVTNTLSTFLNCVSHVHVASVDQMTYEEFIRSIPTPTTIGVLDINPLGKAIIEIDPNISASIINVVFGAKETYACSKHQHELTALERNIMDLIFKKINPFVEDAYKNIIPIQVSTNTIETNPQFISIVHPAEMVVLITMECRIGETEGMINICYPYITLESCISKFATDSLYSSKPVYNPAKTSNVSDNLLLTLRSQILLQGNTLKEIINWKKNDILWPNHRTDLNTCVLKIDDYIVFAGKNVFEENRDTFIDFVKRFFGISISYYKKHIHKKIYITDVQKPYKEDHTMATISNTRVSESLQDVNIEITVELGRTKLPIREILNIHEGSIIELDKLAGEPVDIFANNVKIAEGEVVVIDENFGVRITDIIDKQNMVTSTTDKSYVDGD